MAALAKEGCRSEAEPHWSSLKLCPSPELWDGERAASGVSGTEQMAKLTSHAAHWPRAQVQLDLCRPYMQPPAVGSVDGPPLLCLPSRGRRMP